jgi:hypothetical protein
METKRPASCNNDGYMPVLPQQGLDILVAVNLSSGMWVLTKGIANGGTSTRARRGPVRLPDGPVRGYTSYSL